MPDPDSVQWREPMSRSSACVVTLLLVCVVSAAHYPPLEVARRSETAVTVGNGRISL